MNIKQAKIMKTLAASVLSMSLIAGAGLPAYASNGGTTEPVIEVPVTTITEDGEAVTDAVYKVNPVTQEFEVLVVYKNTTGKKEALQIGKEVQNNLFSGMKVLTLLVNEEGYNKLKANRNIEYVEKNVVMKSQDFSFSSIGKMVSVSSTEQSAWGMEKVEGTKAWDHGFTGKGVKVAVLDSGISSHEELEIAGGISTVDYTDSYEDDNGHGTHVAGIIGAKRDGQGIAGIAPDVKLYAVKVLDKNGDGTIQDIAEGVNWAIENNMDVINMSVGTTYYSPIIDLMIQKAVQEGITVVASAGNRGNSAGVGENISYPAKLDSVIAVTAVDSNLKRASFSATGKRAELAAPGVEIVSTANNGEYEARSGTSMAAPYVTGMVAILKEAYPSKSSEDIRSMLQDNAFDLGTKGKDSRFGYGLASFAKILKGEEQKVEEPATGTTGGQITPQPEPEQKIDLVVLKDATRAVEMAEKYKKEIYINRAVDKVKALPESKEKRELVARLQALGAMKDEVVTQPNEPTTPTNPTEPTTPTPEPEKPVVVDPKQLKDATKAVEYAEKYKKEIYIKRAEEKVNNLPDSPEKAELAKRLAKLTSGKSEDNVSEELKKATEYTEYAERYHSEYFVEKARELLEKLPDSQEKEELLKRLDAIKLP